MQNEAELIPEFFIFHELVKRYHRPDVMRVYLAIQAGLAFCAKETDVGRVMGEMMAEGRGTMSVYCDNIGPEGLAFFYFLFETKLESEGMTDYHHYRFTRRHDRRSTLACLKTDLDPAGESFRKCYVNQLKKLERSRDQIIETHEWPSVSTQFKRYFGNDIDIIEL